MLLRAAIVMLVMLNLGAAGWWWLQPPARLPASETAATPTLQLVGEVGARRALPPVAAMPAVETAAPPANASPLPAPPSKPEPAPAICLRFGPFAEPSARTAAAARLSAAGLTPLTHDSPARAASGWNVYLPPQPSREAAQALADKLKADGITDLYVLTDGAEANSIALGRFSSEAGAQRRQQALQGKGVSAQIAATGAGPVQHWLDARLPAKADRAALANIAAARPLDCARLR